MRLLFLDIDGVLNNEHTKELSVTGFKGLDQRLVEKFRAWYLPKQEHLEIILSSTWRTDPVMVKEIQDAGIKLYTQTDQTNFTHPKTRGVEVDRCVQMYNPAKYAILDDCHEFFGFQLPFFVQTSYRHGLRDRDLAKLDRILN